MIDPRLNDDPSVIRMTFAEGNMTPVERIGDAVVRQSMPWKEGPHALLRHLEQIGYEPAPHLLGGDDTHEWLSYLPGETIPPGIDGFEAERYLIMIGQQARRLHEALASFDISSVKHWQIMIGTPPGTTICHNDFSPWNTLMHDDAFGGVVDWDLASPAPPIWELAWIAWWWGPMYESQRFVSPTEQAKRVAILLDAYGLPSKERIGFVDILRGRMQCGFDTVEVWGQAGVPGFEKLWREGHHLETPNNIAWVEANARDLRAVIERVSR